MTPRRALRALIAVAVAALPVVAFGLPARADVNPGYATYDDGDTDDVGDAIETLTAEADLALLTPTCRPGTATKHAAITYKDAAGQATFGLSHDVTWSWNCKIVTAISHTSEPTIYQPQYSFEGYLHNSTSPGGHPTATATVQGRFGICDHLVGDVCLLERDPDIVWRVDAQGHAKATTTP
jgi:hypothetical protein